MNAFVTATGCMVMLGGFVAIAFGLIGAARARRIGARFDRLLGAVTRKPSPVAEEPRLKLPLPVFVQVDLARADLRTGPVIGTTAMIAGSAAVVGTLWGLLVSVIAGAAVVIGAAAIIHIIAVRRYNRIVAQLPAFVDRVRQYVIAGASLQIAIPRAIENASPLLADVMKPVERRLGHGAGVPESIGWLARRIACAELAMLAAAADANLRFGGQLAGVLANVVRMMRDRLRIGRELKAATAETRASALILALLPLAVAAGILTMQPSHILFFVENPSGRTMLVAMLAAYALGAVLMHRIAKPDY